MDPGGQGDSSAQRLLDGLQREEISHMDHGVLLQGVGDDEEGVEHREGDYGDGGQALRDFPSACGA